MGAITRSAVIIRPLPPYLAWAKRDDTTDIAEQVFEGGWKKLHLGVDRSGVIVARALTEASVDDATTGITLIEATDGALGRVTALST